MRTEERYIELAAKYFDGSISDSEVEDLMEWLKSDKANFDCFIKTRELWNHSSLSLQDESGTEKLLSDFYEKIEEKPGQGKRNHRVIGYIIRIAAVLVAAVLLSGIYELINKEKSHDVLNSITEVKIPAGHKGQVVLPDGTSIWLNSSTTLKYNSSFDEKIKKVYLDGEAYLEVTKDPHRPFQVVTSDLTLQVLGTRFNVKSYSDDDKVETTLIEGSLRILPVSSAKKRDEITLKPNQQAVYFKKGGQINVAQLEAKEDNDESKINPVSLPSNSLPSEIEVVSAWKDGDLIFHDERFADIAIKMERWYGMKVTIADSLLRNERFTGKFVNNETIYQVLGVFDRSDPIQYKTQGKEIIIYKRN